MKRVLHVIISAILISLVFTACAPLIPAASTQGSAPQTAERPAQVQSVEIRIQQAKPPQVTAVVRGNLTESCAVLGKSRTSYAANVFEITLVAVSPSDRGCLQAITPFETTIALDSGSLAPGAYTVNANGVSAVFTLPPDDGARTAVPTAIPPTEPGSAACTDGARFVSDMTIPDNTLMSPGAPFTKTWKLKNTGSCTWDSSYLVSYISGTTMTQQPGYWIVQQGQTVAPGHTVNISVGMTAPVDDGRYASYWGLRREHGQLMPIQGGANENSFYVKIRVESAGGVPAGNITDESVDIELEQGSGAVCSPDATYLVHVSITADGPSTATYELVSSAGQIPAGNFENLSGTGLSPSISATLGFDQPDTKTFGLRFVGPYPHPDDITMQLRVNGGAWHNTKLSCQG